MTSSNVPVSPLHRPSSFNFSRDVVDYWAEKDPSQIALYWTDQTLTSTKQLTYAHFSRQAHGIATLLASLGIKQGETCIVILPRMPGWWELATACLRSGVVLCPCTTLLVANDIEYRLQVSHAAAFIGDEASVAKCLSVRSRCPQLRTVIQIQTANSHGHSVPASSPPEKVIDFHAALGNIPEDVFFSVPDSLTPTSPALTFFTSGTTGPPKMVLHTQISYPLAHALTGIHWLQLNPRKIYWNLSEQGWAKAAWSWFSSWNCGATLFVHDDRMPFNPRRTLQVLHDFPVTTLCAPPTVYRQLVLDENQRFFAQNRPRALTHCCGAGEPLNESVIRVWKEMTPGIEIYDAYGQTETIVVCANQAINPVKPGSMGKPIPGVPLTIVDSEGNVTRENEEGDIAIAVADGQDFFGMFEGYIDKASGKIDGKTQTFPNGKRYYITGDRASRDSEGYFWFVGRNDNVINSAGYRIGKIHSTCSVHGTHTEKA